MSKRKIGAYISWQAMIYRCRSPKARQYKNYGGRGIRVCERWLIFENFLEDMGHRPNGLSIDRINNNLGYFKENCRWATKSEQMRTRSQTLYFKLNGESLTIADIASRYGLPKYAIYQRIKHYGWTVEKAATTPIWGSYKKRLNKISRSW